MQLTEHFALEEMTVSGVAHRLLLDNSPSAAVVENLKRVAEMLEVIRTVLKSLPLLIHSGYRSPAINRLVGGVATSAHCLGLAADFTCPNFGQPSAVAIEICRSSVEYDQLILEYGWVHVSLPEVDKEARRESLTKDSAMSPYENGIRA